MEKKGGGGKGEEEGLEEGAGGGTASELKAPTSLFLLFPFSPP